VLADCAGQQHMQELAELQVSQTKIREIDVPVQKFALEEIWEQGIE